MKLKNKIITVKTVAMTLLAVATLSFIGCIKDKEEDVIVTPPAIPITNTISGQILDKDGKAIVGVDVELSSRTTLANTKTNANGEFAFTPIKKGGNYTITLKKATYNTAVIDFVFKLTPNLSVLKYMPITMVPEGVTKEITTGGGEIKLENKTVATPGVVFNVPAGALTETKSITLTPVAEIANKPNGSAPAAPKNELPLLTLQCAPEGLRFAQACIIEIPNPLADYSITGLKLMYYDNGTWVDSGSVTASGNNYQAKIEHFSNYQVAFNTTLVGSPIVSTQSTAIGGFDNLNGKSEKLVEKLPCKFKSGYEYVKPVSEILATAGVTGVDKDKMELIITEAISSKNLGSSAGIKEVTVNHPINTVIPVGVRLDAKVVQNYTTTTYRINFEKNGNAVPITVTIRAAKTVHVITNTYNKQHQGGNIGQ